MSSNVPRRIRRGLIEAHARRGANGAMSRRSPVPRRIRRGLIEAMLELRERLQSPSRPVPRRIRRGLIEAALRLLGPATNFNRAPFPGEFAGASLKQSAELTSTCWSRSTAGVPRRIRRGLIEAALRLGECGRTMLGQGFVPRRIRRGLIEAGPARRLAQRRERSASFPGEFAGASLKLDQVSTKNQGLLPPGPFPGEFAGASLKPCRRTCHPDSRRSRRRSPANSPGPH